MIHPVIYLHGFASGPSSRKAQFFHDRFAEQGVALETPDLSGGAFESLTITSQLAVIERTAAGRPVSLIGSSMGGYLAALYASRSSNVRKVVLLAPAFAFLRRWPDTFGPEAFEKWRDTGRLSVYHYADRRQRDLGFQLYEDGLQYPEYPDFEQPALIFHGLRDAVVPPEYSERFAATHPNAVLEVLHSDHELVEALPVIWEKVRAFL